MNKRRALVIFGIIISAFFVWVSFKDFRLSEVWALFKKLNGLWLFAGIILLIFSYALRGIRWQLMLAPSHHLRFQTSQGALFISLLGNNIFPWKLGEIWRVFIVRKRDHIPGVTVASSLVLERVYDGLSILFIIWIANIFFHTPIPPVIRKTLFYFGIIVLGSIFTMMLSYRVFAKKMEQKHDQAFWKKIFVGISSLKNSRSNLGMIFFSFIIWLIETYSYSIFIRAFGVPFSFPLGALVLFIGNIFLSIPSAPGNVGTFEYAVILGTTAFGFSKNSGLAMGLMIHFLRFLSTNAVGLYFISAWGMRLTPSTELLAAKENSAQAASHP